MAWDFLPESDEPDNYEEFFAGPILTVAARGSLPLADVSATVERFQLQQRVHQRYGLPIPAIPLADDDPLPAAVLPPIGHSLAPTRGEGEIQALDRGREALARSLDQMGLGIVDLDPAAAREITRRRLSQFLSIRLLAKEQDSRAPRRLAGVIRRRPAATSPASPGLPFKVTTQAPGLRIHWSPAYFYEPEHVFAFGLSTPVDGWLAPGRYIFGAVGPQTDLTFEFGSIYDLPNAQVATMLTV